MPTTRPYRRTSLLLKGHTPGILTLEQQSALSYALQGTHLPQGAALSCFSGGSRPSGRPRRGGACPPARLTTYRRGALFRGADPCTGTGCRV